MQLDRRRLLRLGGAATVASMAALAGCTGSEENDDENGDDGNENGDESDDENGDADIAAESGLPDYEAWLAADDDELTFAYVDWASLGTLEELEAGGEGEPPGLEELEDEDPMLGTPLSGAVAVLFFVGFGVSGSRLTRIVDLEGDTLAADDAETTLDDLLLVDDAIVFRGDVDAAEVEDALGEPIDDPYVNDADYEHVDDRGEFAIYETVATDDGDEFGTPSSEAIAVGPDAIVFAADSETGDEMEHVRRVLEVYAGDADGATEENEAFDWSLRAAGRGQFVFGGYGETGADRAEAESADDELEEATGLVSSLTVADDGSAEGDFAVTFETLDDETEAELEARLGASADDVTLEFEADRVSASASWDAIDEALE